MGSIRSQLRKIKFLRNLKRSMVGPRLPHHLQVIEDVEGMVSLEEADLLYRLARDTAEGCIVEIGSYRGRSTVALAYGALAGSGAAVFAVDPHETFRGVLGGSFGPADRAAFFKSMLDTSAYEVVRLINLSSEVVTPGWQLPVGCLWIDGDHTYEAVSRDYRCWSPHLTAGCRVAFDDALNPEIGPRRLIDEIVASGTFQLTGTTGKIAVLKRSTRD